MRDQKWHLRAVIVITLISIFAIYVSAKGDPSSNAHLKRYLLSSGGALDIGSSNHKASLSIGETAIASGASQYHRTGQGFFQNSTGTNPACDYPGDANGDTQTNVGDAVYLINYVFKGGPAPTIASQGDANADCQVNVGDAVYLINYVFKGGSAPECGCAD